MISRACGNPVISKIINSKKQKELPVCNLLPFANSFDPDQA